MEHRTQIGFWNGKPDGAGLLHRPDPARCRCPNSLLMFVHGFQGKTETTWGDIPSMIVAELQSDLTVASFDYPSGPLEDAAIATAATDLKEFLRRCHPTATDVVFVVHSTGGLVVKRLLIDEFNDHREILLKTQMALNEPKCPYWVRTRRVFNIAVPHLGARKLLTAPTAPIYEFLKLISNLPFIPNNDIIPFLRHKGEKVLSLDSDFASAMETSDGFDLPRPYSFDIVARTDAVIPRGFQVIRKGAASHSGGTQLKLFYADDLNRAVTEEIGVEVQGGHTSIKLDEMDSAPVRHLIVSELKRHLRPGDLALAATSLLRIARVHDDLEVIRLVGDVRKGDKFPPSNSRQKTMPAASVGSTQLKVLEKLLREIRKDDQELQHLVVTGGPGVGKTVVARALVAKHNHRFLSAFGRTERIGILVPLQLVKLDVALFHGLLSTQDPGQSQFGSEMGAELVKNLWQWWSMWVEGYLGEPVPEGWIEERLSHSACTVIIDGVDEFAAHHPRLGAAGCYALINELGARYKTNRKVKFALFARSSLRYLDRFGNSNDSRLLEILPLTAEQADQAFPGAEKWLKSIRDRELRKLLCTPFFLAANQKDFRKPLPAHSTYTHLLRRTLDRLVRKRRQSGQSRPFPEVLCALSLMTRIGCWHGFMRQIPRALFAKEVPKLIQRWTAHLALRDATGSETLMKGFGQIADQRSLDALLDRTVFLPSHESYVQCAHQLWEELLVACYIDLCVRFGHFTELSDRAFNLRIYRRAGALLSTHLLQAKELETILKLPIQQCRFALGNLLAIVANSSMKLDGKSTVLLTSLIEHEDVSVQFMALSTLGYRAYAGTDPVAKSLRRLIIHKAERLCAPPAVSSNRVLASAAWCYLRGFQEHSEPKKAPSTPPLLGDAQLGDTHVLDIVCHRTADGRHIFPTENETAQIGFLRYIERAAREPARLISAVHYLYCLVEAIIAAHFSPEVGDTVPYLLKPESTLAKAVEDRSKQMPHLKTIFKTCQRRYEEAHR